MKTAQPFRPHILDMFEPQDHPDDFAYPGGPPIPPYDNAGWTLAYQMGVVFDRVLEGFDRPFEKVSGMAKPPAGMVAPATNAVGFLLSHQTNGELDALMVRIYITNPEEPQFKEISSRQSALQGDCD